MVHLNYCFRDSSEGSQPNLAGETANLVLQVQVQYTNITVRGAIYKIYTVVQNYSS